MTTNNPPIAAWAPSTALAKLASRHNNAPCVLTDGPAEFNDVALIRISEYRRLQADHKRLQAECEKLRKLHQDAYRRGFHEGSMGLREAYDAIQEIKRQDAWGNAQLTEALLAAEDRAERVEIENAALTAECEELRTALAESRANDLTAMGYLNQIRQLVGGDDFPDMVERVKALQAENALLRTAIRRLCNIYVVDDYYMGQLREERLEAAVNQAIEQVKETTK